MLVLLLDDSCKAAANELANIDGVPCGQVVEVVVPAWDLEGTVGVSSWIYEDEIILTK